MDCSFRNGLRGVVALAIGLVTPGLAPAADNGFYLGASASDVSSDYASPLPIGPTRDDDGFKLIGGFRPLDGFAIEANYADFGTTRVPLNIACLTTPCPQEGSLDSQALSVSAVGLFTLPLVDLYGRVGVARWESDRRFVGAAELEGTDPTYGLGVQLRVGSFAVRVEYERFELGDDDVDLRSVGFTYTFL